MGQRTAQETFNVRIEGVDAAIADNDLEHWSAAYRLGVASGLLFSPDEIPTITALNLRLALRIYLPVTDAPDEIAKLLRRVRATRAPGPLPGDPSTNADLLWFVEQNAGSRPATESGAWNELARHLRGESTAAAVGD
ncbi:hypothetical protein OG809_33700 [Kribbella soli]